MFEWYFAKPYALTGTYVEQAFHMLYEDEYLRERDLFAQKWGGFDLHRCQRVLGEGQGEEREVVFYLLTLSQVPQAQEVLLPFLHASNPRDRWLATVMLGEMGEEKARANLCTMLTEFLPEKEHPGSEEYRKEPWWYEEKRPRIVWILQKWSHPDIPVALGQAFRQQVLREPYYLTHSDYCHTYEDVLTYELGYRGAFGALTGMALSSTRSQLACLTMAFGSYDALMHPTDIRRKTTTRRILLAVAEWDALAPDISAILMSRCAYSQEEAHDALYNFVHNMNSRTEEEFSHR